MKIGFIGIGVMGESMARHLMEKGHSLTVYNRTKSKADRLLAEGAVWAESAGACAKDRGCRDYHRGISQGRGGGLPWRRAVFWTAPGPART